MNYRHAYHAGSFADVLKHIVLTLVLRHLVQKPTPFRIIDLHAGMGLYDLTSEEAAKTGEWQQGIAKLFTASEGLTMEFEPYMSVVRAFNADSGMSKYPGSPLIARTFLRPGDVLIANELHPEDNSRLAAHFSRDKQVRVMALDAWTAIKALLPPKERRGLVLIDPPFEEPDELQRMIRGLEEGLSRFANGIYLLWYPIKDHKPIDRFKRQVAALCPAPVLSCEVLLHPPSNPYRLNGAGMLIVNPPFTMHASMNNLAPTLLRRISNDPAATCPITWLRVPDHHTDHVSSPTERQVRPRSQRPAKRRR